MNERTFVGGRGLVDVVGEFVKRVSQLGFGGSRRDAHI